MTTPLIEAGFAQLDRLEELERRSTDDAVLVVIAKLRERVARGAEFAAVNEEMIELLGDCLERG